MTVIPETRRNADWDRKVSREVNVAQTRIKGLQETAPSRAALWFFR